MSLVKAQRSSGLDVFVEKCILFFTMVFFFYENFSHCDPYLHYATKEAERWFKRRKEKNTIYEESGSEVSEHKPIKAKLLHFKRGNWSIPYDSKELAEHEKLSPKYKPTVTALPFKDDEPSVPSGSTESPEHTEGGSPDSEDNESEDAEALRVTTRADVPYHHFGNSKKAMLLLHISTSKHSREYDETVPGKMAEITDTFSRFGFEIEQHIDLTDDKHLRKTCRNFFRRDFNDYCCVAVVLLNGDLKDSHYYLNDRDFDIVRHLIIEENRTMRGKPKIYINETNWSYGTGFRRDGVRRYCVPITEFYHPDVLCLHVPAISYYRRVTQPLTIFCNKLVTMVDEDLMTVIKETVLALEPQFKAWTFVATTQQKRLYLNSTV